MVFSFLTAVRPRRALAAALALAVALVVAAAPAQPAFASAAPGASAADCRPDQDPHQCNYLYLYRLTDFAGEADRFPHQPDNTCAELTSPLISGSGSLDNELGRFGNGSDRADTPGQAVLLFAGAGCTGASYRFSSGSQSPDLTALGFAAAVSVKFVPDPCEVYLDATGRWKNLNVCVYADAGYAGAVQVFPSRPANTCVVLQPSLQLQVTALRNNLFDDGASPTLQQDVLLFAGDNCTGDGDRWNASTWDPDMDFDNRARSIKFVVNPCTSDTMLCLWGNFHTEGPVQIITAPREGACTNLNAALTGQVSSYWNRLLSPNRQDVALFAGDNCTGAAKRLDAGSAKSKLSEIAFDNKARSVRFVTDSCRWGNSLCLYTDAYYEGEAQVIRSPAARSCANLRSGISGQVSSIRNWLADSSAGNFFLVEVYTGAGCTGTTRRLSPNSLESNLAGTAFENSIKSVRFVPA